MLRLCKHCGGDGFELKVCGCHEALCPHTPFFGSPEDKIAGIYHKFWVRRTDGSSNSGGKHERCEYFALDWKHDSFAIPAARAYADACEATYPDLALDLRERAKRAERGARRRGPR